MIEHDKCILVTGATGFIARALIKRLQADARHRVIGTVRKQLKDSSGRASLIHIGELSPDLDWRNVLAGVDVVVHTAARVHIAGDDTPHSQHLFKRINTEAVLNLARQAAKSGIRRFIFLSSIKVNGGRTDPGQFFSAEDVPNPQGAYGLSKLEAEYGLYEIGAKSGMELVCIRPPLVYGPGVKGNFLSMMRWLRRDIPLPLGAVNNQRSLVALDNLVDLIIICLDHAAAANQTFLVSDDEDQSTTELLRRTGIAIGSPPCLFPVPVKIVQLGARLIGKKGMARRLLDSLQLDISKTKKLLGWKPPVSVNKGLHQTAAWFLKQE